MRTQKLLCHYALALVFAGFLTPDAFAEEVERDTETMVVHSTAEEALKQQPGVSIITAEDIAKDPRLTISQKSSVKCPASI
jgi:ferric enterobactin receptor